MKRWKTWLGISMIFISGMAVGGVATGIVIKNRIAAFILRTPEQRLENSMKKLTKMLTLNSDQQQKLVPIVAKSQNDVADVIKQAKKDIQDRIKNAAEEARPILSKQQQDIVDAQLRADLSPPN